MDQSIASNRIRIMTCVFGVGGLWTLVRTVSKRLAAKTASLRMFRSAGDDSITVGGNKVCTITEIQR